MIYQRGKVIYQIGKIIYQPGRNKLCSHRACEGCMQSFNIVVKRVYNDGGAKHRVSYPFQLFWGNFSNEAHETEMHLSPSTKNCTSFCSCFLDNYL